VTPCDEIRDSAALIEILDWISVCRQADNFEFVINPTVRGGRDVVMPGWLTQQMLSDLEVYATQRLKERNIEYVPKPL
jgi:hypothetical protein